ncbi:EXOIII-like protein [Fragilaria crotonensis]|nr:EXOIII-like protein [Fragilaria crotonensis]
MEGQEITSDDNLNDESAQDKSDEPVKKKPKKSFPSINALLQQNKLDQSKQQQEAAVLQAQSALPSSYTSRYVAIDCEMVGIGTDGKQSALARVSMVDWHGEVLLDTFVQVPSRVTDFRTHVSGVTAKDIQPRATNKDGSHNGGAMDVKVCREKVAAILKDKILVGHALHNDLQALLLQHPKEDIRDTAKYRPFQSCRYQMASTKVEGFG